MIEKSGQTLEWLSKNRMFRELGHRKDSVSVGVLLYRKNVDKLSAEPERQLEKIIEMVFLK